MRPWENKVDFSVGFRLAYQPAMKYSAKGLFHVLTDCRHQGSGANSRFDCINAVSNTHCEIYFERNRAVQCLKALSQ